MKCKNFCRDILKCDLKEGWSELHSDSNKGVEMPSVQKSCSSEDKLIDLVEPEQFDFDTKLVDVVRNRRSRRKYTKDQLTIKELSFLLWATQGITEQDIFEHRAVPAASASHPFETYLIIQKVKNLKPGVYRYIPIEHKLCLVSEQIAGLNKICASCFEVNQPQINNSAVIFIWAAVPYRTEWRFGPYAYKFIAIGAGHVCQNLYLATETIHAGACAIGAYDQDIVDKIIRVNGIDEFAVYLATVGRVALTN